MGHVTFFNTSAHPRCAIVYFRFKEFFPIKKKTHFLFAICKELYKHHFKSRLHAFIVKLSFGYITLKIKIEDKLSVSVDDNALNANKIQIKVKKNLWGMHTLSAFRKEYVWWMTKIFILKFKIVLMEGLKKTFTYLFLWSGTQYIWCFSFFSLKIAKVYDISTI